MGQFLIDPQFSSDVLRFYLTIESVSFSGVFFIDSIANFFKGIQRKINEGLPCNIKHFSFTGNSRYRNMEQESFTYIFQRINQIFKETPLETITLSGVSTLTFATIINILTCKTLELNSMKIVNSGSEITRYAIYNTHVEKLILTMTVVDEQSLKAIRGMMLCIRIVSISEREWNLWTTDMQEDWTWEPLEHDASEDFVTAVHSYAHRFVFEYLEYEDLLSFSEVSKAWFDASLDYVSEKSTFLLEGPVQRKRQYHSVRMEVTNDPLRKLNLIQELVPDLQNLDLSFGENSLTYTNNFFSMTRFSNLTCLRLMSDDEEPIDYSDFSTCPTLQELHLNLFRFDSETPQETRFIKYLLNASKLEVLSFVDCKHLKRMFVNETLSAVPFRLKTLQMPTSELNGTAINNFNVFLMLHSDTLQELSLDTADRTTIQNIIDHFHLTDLTFFEITGGALFGGSPSIRKIQLRFNNLQQLEVYLKVAPKVEVLQIPVLNDAILRHLRQSYPSLREILSGRNELQEESLGLINLVVEKEEFDSLAMDEVRENNVEEENVVEEDVDMIDA
jgi:hypothetical protein